MLDRHYGGVIWTKHALGRLSERGFTQELAWETFRHPDTTALAKEGGTSFQKRVGSSVVTIIGKKNEHNEWIIISCWIHPPLEGTVDYKRWQAYKNYQKASFWGKLWYTLKRQLGFF